MVQTEKIKESIMKRKIIAAMLAVAMIGSVMAAQVSAENTTSAQSEITMYQPYDPVYTVTIPETIEVDTKEVTSVPVTASDVQYIPEGKKISVTLTKGSGTYGRLYLEAENPDGGKNYLMTMMIKGTDGEFKSGALENQIKGMELASFTEDGTANFEMYPCAFDYPDSTNQNLTIQKGVEYKGSMTFGVELKDI